MSKVIRRLAVLVCVFVVSMTLRAGTIDDLYEGRAEFTNSTEAAARDAMRQVLIKVSGSAQILSDDLVRSNLRRARDFVLSYRFEQQEQANYYIATLDQEKINALIKNARFPIWPAVRPATLVWLAAKDDHQERYILSDSSQNPLREAIKSVSTERGVDLILPLMDLDDLSTVSAFDVWARYMQPILEASTRYQPDELISARVYFRDQPEPMREPGPGEAIDLETFVAAEEERIAAFVPQWVVEWTYQSGSKIQFFDVAGETPESVVRAFMHQIADSQANRYAIAANGLSHSPERLNITLTQLTSLKQVELAQRYLQSKAAISTVQLALLDSEKAVFSVSLLGTEFDLRSALKLDNRIKPVRDAFGQPVDTLEYIWIE